MSSAPTSLPSPAASSEAFVPASVNHGVSNQLRSPGLFQPVQLDGEAEHHVERNRRREGKKRERLGRKDGVGSLNPFAKEFVPATEFGISGRAPNTSFDPQFGRSGGRNQGSSNGNSRRSRGARDKHSVIFREDVRKSNFEYSTTGNSMTSSGGGLSASLREGGHGQTSHRATSGAQSSSIRIPGGQSSTSNAQTSGAGTTPPSSRRGQGSSANHLLNFQYDTIPRPPPRAPLARKSGKPQPYNKELFLQANFRFLVSDFGDYMLNTSDPDKMLEWEDVAAVNFSAPVPVQCPICLDRPLCPQITTCGHIFCFPCALRYLLMGVAQDIRSEHGKKCPLCFAWISTKELRTVSIDDVHQHGVGDTVKFTLLTRDKLSIIPFEKTDMARGPLAYSKDGQCHLFSKFTLTSDAEPTTSQAITELTSWAAKVQLEGGEDMELLPFVFVAVDQLQQRKVAWTEHRTMEFLSSSPPVRQRIMAQAKLGTAVASGNVSSNTPQKPKTSDGVEDLEVFSTLVRTASKGKIDPGKVDVVAETEAAMAELKGKAGWVYESAFSDDEVETVTTRKMKGLCTQTVGNRVQLKSETSTELVAQKADAGNESISHPDIENITIREDMEKKDIQSKIDQEERESYTFYQSADGQILILHPLNVKCLLHHYGSYEALPTSLEAELVELEAVTQTEATRKRYRYLSHLPLTAVFNFCEVDLGNFLPNSVMLPFAEELRRRDMRRRRILEQDKEQRALEERIAAAEVARHAPPTDADFAAALTVLQMEGGLHSSGDLEDHFGNSPTSSMSPPEHDERRLFSRVAQLGFASGYDAPDLISGRPTADSSPTSSPTSSAWTAEAGPSRGPMSFADIIVAQAAKAEEEGSVVGNKVGSKKGKKASKVIMSTAGGRRY